MSRGGGTIVSVSVKKAGWIKFKRNLLNSDFLVQAGWFDGAIHPNGRSDASVAQIAQWLDEGFTDRGGNRVPARPFMSKVYKELERYYGVDKVIASLKARGRYTEAELHAVGRDMVTIMQLAIEEGSYAILKESTVRRKGSDIPLIETHFLKNSVQYRISKKAMANTQSNNESRRKLTQNKVGAAARRSFKR